MLTIHRTYSAKPCPVYLWSTLIWKKLLATNCGYAGKLVNTKYNLGSLSLAIICEWFVHTSQKAWWGRSPSCEVGYAYFVHEHCLWMPAVDDEEDVMLIEGMDVKSYAISNLSYTECCRFAWGAIKPLSYLAVGSNLWTILLPFEKMLLICRTGLQITTYCRSLHFTFIVVWFILGELHCYCQN